MKRLRRNFRKSSLSSGLLQNFEAAAAAEGGGIRAKGVNRPVQGGFSSVRWDSPSSTASDAFGAILARKHTPRMKGDSMGTDDEKRPEDRLKELKKKMIDLEAKAKKHGVEAEAEWKRAKSKLKRRLEKAREQLDETSSDMGRAGREVGQGVKDALGDLRRAYERAVEQLGEDEE